MYHNLCGSANFHKANIFMSNVKKENRKFGRDLPGMTCSIMVVAPQLAAFVKTHWIGPLGEKN